MPISARTYFRHICVPGIGSHGQQAVQCRYWVDALPRDLIDNERRRQCLHRITKKLFTETLRQDEFDNANKECTDTIHHEMDQKLHFKDYSPSLSNHRKIAKPYWTDEFTTFWKLVRDCKRSHLTFRGCTRKKREMKDTFTDKGNLFDKCLRKTQGNTTSPCKHILIAWTPKTQMHSGKSFENWDRKEIADQIYTKYSLMMAVSPMTQTS